ncbi:glutathione S-transferase family protein [Cohaesibacter gelatinilyticus]|uniref:Glutathione S-transferase n=1 Tax=Cohaesibacter gelatinilyticus TaxID=372072 RepID=A0A285N9M4_9HYPH|nr:glutathione S-transferase family protein [Cohaesibacter gelatinilyticus]SNZ06192.1 glutathione S-transferase [Cohaesibacter gelatinilyticus]
MTYKLYWYPGSAAMAPHAILHDIGKDFELIEAKGAFLKSADYLRKNPNGTVPVLVCENGETLYESAAICQFLAERHPETGLCPAIDDPCRGKYLQWMMHLTNTVQEAMTIWWHPDQYTNIPEVQAKLKYEAEARLAKLWQVLDGHLQENGPLLCGDRFFACDYYLAMLIRWTRDMREPGESFPYLNRLVSMAMARPAYKKMLQDQNITQNVLPDTIGTPSMDCQSEGEGFCD